MKLSKTFQQTAVICFELGSRYGLGLAQGRRLPIDQGAVKRNFLKQLEKKKI